ncbi:30S ribosomal protein S3 [Candidatus Roizmanbacteria bacterium RIFCSPLOWO2_02_FULL_37_19]|uniref:Small ribosomal subunit protein uS3 n=1 Tax=Candidatus Roizmanbacteria bacterium RIFCSPHIGHO2_02_FULL_37_24 TaxID=1802037 RepID=A0A1F7GVX6_9BACT|nr:MAG: 30S ribosomal protein S3 [Candidatus Roizmanbacteria bacterium RIFCSPHIGHO2_01_FULL_38_41]OGK23061.1 MAG: 30S ribosomal protein S3 [Candidatus Roizmanbacteria bacterium RIFCSPHIGHO2_02_FULL_37_24]OGK33412.1 MAG: 30S ribosomal protein S3 [Candidatus Roizmanbacteria bacterium RIFCSPHIGHO2_12_FULL_37_23]OGK43476.1 MAG: 30S ribosomal protein S3 [Candidatus Roizmanbacteria bacterium RIFCSPLOWO2_01_FULL_37_57]OGK54421.1 MAG: 30S ribosomal protein S3 [Candidatus Roizmanbacteria bacterium RIFCS
MGQKVHPRGFRLGVTKTWDSRWMFPDKRTYKESLLSDIKIRKGIMEKFKFSLVTRVEIERAINKLNIIIHAVKPGMIIGRGGKGLEEVKKFVVDTLGKDKVDKEKIKIDLKIEPVKKPYLNAYYVAADIGSKLERNLPHRVIVHHGMDRVLEAGAKGVKIQLSGRIRGATIARREKYSQGTVPVSTIREDIDYAQYPALTKSGYVGVKVWIARKEI